MVLTQFSHRKLASISSHAVHAGDVRLGTRRGNRSQPHLHGVHGRGCAVRGARGWWEGSPREIPERTRDFRRQWVPIESDVMDEIVRSNCTHRMRSYLESGCILPYQNISNLRHLHSCERELECYINEANVVLKRLECLVEDAYDATLTANLSAVKVLDYSSADSKMKHEKQEQPADQLDRDSSLVTVMILVHNMLKLDYTMQGQVTVP
uniref:Uncharacterized protein n=1 Tax=Avena sativa TaxID=4498 RepID=A0ACD5YSF9_AVESA